MAQDGTSSVASLFGYGSRGMKLEGELYKYYEQLLVLSHS